MHQRSFALLAAAAVAACSSGSKRTSPPEPPPNPPSFTTFQAAEQVIGQPDFATTAPPAAGAPGPATVDTATGSAAFDGTRLFLPDTYDQRILGFAGIPSVNGASASVVLGQPGPGSSTAGATASSWYLPMGLSAGAATLAVAEAGNHRVLLLPTNSESGAAAQVAVGWGDLVTARHGCARDRLEAPSAAVIAGEKLLVADRGNNRILIWNALPSSSGAPADLVLGHASFTSCSENDSMQDGSAGLRSASSLRGPAGIWSDGVRIVVADRGNNRVLIWSHFPTSNGAPADLVLGQTAPPAPAVQPTGTVPLTAFNMARAQATVDGLSAPAAVASDGHVLVIADSGNNRVVGWTEIPTTSGAPATFVLGQGNFTASAANDDGQAGVSGAATARTLSLPTGVAFAGQDLLVTDSLNRRLLLFRRH